MTALTWDQVGERVFEGGVDRGVLYLPDRSGVAWNGLISIEEQSTSSVSPAHFDGIKYADIVTVGDFEARLRAYTYPDEFLQFEGILEDQTGVSVTGQPVEQFHLAYRTRVGNDVDPDLAYKLHILYNLTAIPAEKEYATLSMDSEPLEFEWDLTAIPEPIEGFRPTAHIILDTRKIDPLLMIDIEEILYGNAENEPRLPSLKGLTSFIRKWDRLIITDNGDGTWTATTNAPGIIEMLDSVTFQITSDTATYLDPPDNTTYEIESSEKNEEDIWL